MLARAGRGASARGLKSGTCRPGSAIAAVRPSQALSLPGLSFLIFRAWGRKGPARCPAKHLAPSEGSACCGCEKQPTPKPYQHLANPAGLCLQRPESTGETNETRDGTQRCHPPSSQHPSCQHGESLGPHFLSHLEVICNPNKCTHRCCACITCLRTRPCHPEKRGPPRAQLIGCWGQLVHPALSYLLRADRWYRGVGHGWEQCQRGGILVKA